MFFNEPSLMLAPKERVLYGSLGWFRCTLVDAERLAGGHVLESVAIATTTVELELLAESNRRVVVIVGLCDTISIAEKTGIRGACALINCLKYFSLIFLKLFYNFSF